MSDDAVRERTESVPPLRAYILPGREFTASWSSGSRILCGRIWGRLGRSCETVWGRLGCIACAGYGLYHAQSHVTPFAVPVAGLAWSIAALALSPDPRSGSRRAGAQDPAGDVGGREHLDDAGECYSPSAGDVAALVREVAVRRGHQGAHLDDLIDTGVLGEWDKTDLKAALDEWGIEVTEFKLRFEGRQRVRLGVRLRDLPAGLGEALALAPGEASAGVPSGAAEVPPAGHVEAPVEGPVTVSPESGDGPLQRPR